VAETPTVLIPPESDASLSSLTPPNRSGILQEPAAAGPAAPEQADGGVRHDEKGLRVVIRYVEPEDPAAYAAAMSDARRAFIETILDELADGRLKL
jgi:hypothetical protein